MNITVEDLQKYYNDLRNHDWFYDYSDDNLVWRRGLAEREYLKGLATKHPQFDEMYRQFSRWVYRIAHNDKDATEPEYPT